MISAAVLLPVVGLARADTHSISLGDVGWSPHPEVWTLMLGVAAIGFYMRRILEPKAVAAGYAPMTRAQKIWFLMAGVSLWAVSDWPIHDVAERYLYSVHMFQHLFISMLVPAMFLLALPPWLFELLWPAGSRGYRIWARLTRPVVAGVLFNGLTILLHWSKMVAWADEFGPLHFSLHLMIFSAGLLMWMPVVGPVREWRLPPIGQCIYLFMMSIVPTVPGGWLVFSEGVVYRNYDIPERLWGIGVLSDQQGAGVVMKLMGGFVLWAIIVTIFARWASAEARQDEAERRVRQADQREARRLAAEASAEAEAAAMNVPLTYEEVAEHFARTPAPSEPHP